MRFRPECSQEVKSLGEGHDLLTIVLDGVHLFLVNTWLLLVSITILAIPGQTR